MILSRQKLVELKMSANYPLTLLYDAQCPVCSLEMDHLRERCTDGRLRFVDISQPGFDAAPYGVSYEAMDAEIHGVRPDGSLLKGVGVLRLAYDAAGLGWVMRPTGWAPLRLAFDAGYRLFARHRRRISAVAAPLIAAVRAQRARRVAQAMRDCRAGTCDVSRSNEPGSSS
jgi:predicted DCC family thiol-disulfide oxidoreductase YuxK